ncbi:hypothetical protein ACWDR2_17090 [Streptomyces sp. NPDC003631]|jgi:hypothetical protein|uniref:Uncharacterized protein n=1 Tax=Streptomyces lannensis TaxID=766498 RepID=A0ABP7KAE2_9ACTN|nr:MULTISPECIES: hypothetical protein [unclassified Streptomyces]MEE1670065.1 hypothetical protein [Streptomyces sp. WAC07094]KUJ54156.1 hypothetical protein ADL25_06760 [Streptomyces sp. NRRL F-5122]MBW8705036.1 hypothetical protein [Streptomyces sp. MBT84]MDX3261848.1 hypothetical protein [Streptomyces sp. MI02-2A]REE59238.1 hypothetical protein BX257_1741 [Streptomyces sp. 3212.3]
MTDREHDRYADESGHLKDMTEETLGAQEQERQERQHRQDARRQDGRRTEERTFSLEQGDDEYR